MDCRWCHTCCGWMGKGWLPSGRRRCGRNGMLIGVGFPMISLSRPIWLWNPVVVLTPPLNQVEYDAAPRITEPGLPSVMKRWWIAAPTSSMPWGTSGS